MVIIVKHLVPVYKKSEPVPKKWLNLRKAVFVTSFKHLYPKITDILVSQYGLLPEEKIVVFWTKEISLPQFARYRMNFRKVYSGPLSDFSVYAEKIRGRKKKEKDKKGEPLYSKWS